MCTRITSETKNGYHASWDASSHSLPPGVGAASESRSKFPIKGLHPVIWLLRPALLSSSPWVPGRPYRIQSGVLMTSAEAQPSSLFAKPSPLCKDSRGQGHKVAPDPKPRGKAAPPHRDLLPSKACTFQCGSLGVQGGGWPGRGAVPDVPRPREGASAGDTRWAAAPSPSPSPRRVPESSPPPERWFGRKSIQLPSS